MLKDKLRAKQMFRDLYLSWKIPFYNNQLKVHSEKRIQAYLVQEEEKMERWAIQYDKMEYD